MRRLQNFHLLAAVAWAAVVLFGQWRMQAGLQSDDPSWSAARWLLACPTVISLGLVANALAAAWFAALARRAGASWRPLAWAWSLSWQCCAAAAVFGIVVVGHAEPVRSLESPAWIDPALMALLAIAALVFLPPAIATWGAGHGAVWLLAAGIFWALWRRFAGDLSTNQAAEFPHVAWGALAWGAVAAPLALGAVAAWMSPRRSRDEDAPWLDSNSWPLILVVPAAAVWVVACVPFHGETIAGLPAERAFAAAAIGIATIAWILWRRTARRITCGPCNKRKIAATATILLAACATFLAAPLALAPDRGNPAASIAAEELLGPNLIDRFDATRAAFPETFARGLREPSRTTYVEALRRGRRVYLSEGCWNCHAQQALGGAEEYELSEISAPAVSPPRFAAPDLSCIAGRITPEVLALHLAEPRLLDAGSTAPAFGWLFDGEPRRPTGDGLALILYLQAFGVGEDYPCTP